MPRIERRASIRVPKSGKKLVCSINRWGLVGTEGGES